MDEKAVDRRCIGGYMSAYWMVEMCIRDRYGADILRLWVASSDYHADIRISKDILKQLSEVYRKIRNTARYILGNISDFDPKTDMVSFEDLTELDQWALAKFNELVAKLEEAYDNYEFHIIYHALHNFCTIDMSNFYLDVIKDRLYVEGKSSQGRRAAHLAVTFTAVLFAFQFKKALGKISDTQSI